MTKAISNNITNDKVVDFLEKYYKPSSNKLHELRIAAEKDSVPIILPETEMLLKSILLISKPKKILEIGTAVGYSALFFSTICKDSIVYTVEKSNEMCDIAKENIKLFDKENQIVQFLDDGEAAIDTIREKGIKDFDFVFIDAAKSHYKRFLDAILPLCKDGTLIVSDNILFKGKTVSDEYDVNNKYKTSIRKMREYIDYICSNSTLDTTINSVGDGVAISIINNKRINND